MSRRLLPMLLIFFLAGCATTNTQTITMDPLPPYTPPKPQEMDVPEGTKIGFVGAMYSGNEWITPPPIAGETIALAYPKVSKMGGSYFLGGVGDMGKLRVFDVKEYSRQQIGQLITVIFQVAYKKETIRVNIPYEITNEPE